MMIETEVLAAFISINRQYLHQAIPDLFNVRTVRSSCNDIKAGFQIARALAEEGIRLGWLPRQTAQRLSLEQPPSSMTDVRTNNTKVKRKRVLEDARKNHPLQNGSLAPVNEIFAAYGRKQFQLNGKLATNQKLDDQSKCKQYPSSKDCVIVNQDFI